MINFGVRLKGLLVFNVKVNDMVKLGINNLEGFLPTRIAKHSQTGFCFPNILLKLEKLSSTQLPYIWLYKNCF